MTAPTTAPTPEPADDDSHNTAHDPRVAVLLAAQREAIRRAVDDAPPVPLDVANRLRTLFGRIHLPPTPTDPHPDPEAADTHQPHSPTQ